MVLANGQQPVRLHTLWKGSVNAFLSATVALLRISMPLSWSRTLCNIVTYVEQLNRPYSHDTSFNVDEILSTYTNLVE